MRFLLEVMEEIFRQVGPDYPVCVRVSGTDYEPDGTTIEETTELCRRLESMGVAVIHMSGGNHHQTIHEVSPMGMSLAHNVWAAEAVKKELNIPVIASGSIPNPELAESILKEGKGDFVALGRPLWADPHWPIKAMEGRPEDIRPCIRCNDGCLARGDHQAKTIACSVNVAVCREDEFRITQARQPRNVAVIGGGPAGMEAARVCALKGHKVTLYEKRELGGALIEASVPEFKAPDLKPLIQYLVTQIKKLKIKVIKQEATPKTVKEGGFDAAIIATGATPFFPESVPKIKSSKVTTALHVLQGRKKLGQTIAVIGGGVVGTEVGLFLAEQGKDVIFVEMLDAFMNGITFDEKLVYEERFKALNISIHTGRRLEAVTDEGITVVDRYGVSTPMTVDNIVLASGFRPNRDLIDRLKKSSEIQIYEVGDCVGPRKIFDAIHEGHLAAKLLA
jgi:NADPH-dependent 2,4-dienoyl-CoA reductase/sulfur reductase-like enzyme